MAGDSHIVGHIATGLAELAYPVDLLDELPGNPNIGDVAAVARMYEKFGQLKPIVAKHSPDQPERGTVYAGNTQLRAARDRLEWTHIAVTWADDLSDDEAWAFAVGDNHTGRMGSDDPELLLEALERVRGADKDLLAAASYAERDLATLHNALARHREGLGDPDAAPPLPEQPRSKTGQVWILGDHRLVVGDSTRAATWTALMGIDLASVIWTDPPYGVDYQSDYRRPEDAKAAHRRTDGLVITGDQGETIHETLTDAFTAATAIIEPGASFYIACPAGPKGTEFRLVLGEVGWMHRQTLVWVKDVFVMGRSDYHYRHEEILYGSIPGQGRLGRGKSETSRWYGDNSQDSVSEVATVKPRKSAKKGGDQDSVMQIPRPRVSKEHPTMKPVELVRRGLVNSSQPDDIVIDPFAGSGSTLIACHITLRRARLVEKDPRYADVILRRYQAFTGDKPVLEETGEPEDWS